MYCEEEYEFRAVESEDRPSNVESKPTYGGVTSGRCTKVQTAPCADEQRAEAKRDDPESAPLRWFWHPNWRGVARSGGIGRRILHLFCGSVRTIGPAWLRESGDLYARVLYGSHIRCVKMPHGGGVHGSGAFQNRNRYGKYRN